MGGSQHRRHCCSAAFLLDEAIPGMKICGAVSTGFCWQLLGSAAVRGAGAEGGGAPMRPCRSTLLILGLSHCPRLLFLSLLQFGLVEAQKLFVKREQFLLGSLHMQHCIHPRGSRSKKPLLCRYLNGNLVGLLSTEQQIYSGHLLLIGNMTLF